MAGGDICAGVLLSQIVFWNLPDKDGDEKLRVRHNGKLWLAKTRNDWWNECRLKPRQYDRSIMVLKKVGLVELAVFKFAGTPTTHIRLNDKVFIELLESKIKGGITKR